MCPDTFVHTFEHLICKTEYQCRHLFKFSANLMKKARVAHQTRMLWLWNHVLILNWNTHIRTYTLPRETNKFLNFIAHEIFHTQARIYWNHLDSSVETARHFYHTFLQWSDICIVSGSQGKPTKQEKNKERHSNQANHNSGEKRQVITFYSNKCVYVCFCRIYFDVFGPIVLKIPNDKRLRAFK